jgi:hypothetical protein
MGNPEDGEGTPHGGAGSGHVTALRTHRTRQLEERLAMGGDYHDQDLVVCQVDGTPIHPKTISYQFGKAIRAAKLPPIRLHDLRHTHATLALKAGIHPRIVQERLGHANVSITLDTYSLVDLDMQAAAARQVAALVVAAPPTERSWKSCDHPVTTRPENDGSRRPRRPLTCGNVASTWRWRWDLNPRRSYPLTRFRGVLLRPLGHATGRESSGGRGGSRRTRAAPSRTRPRARRARPADGG